MCFNQESPFVGFLWSRPEDNVSLLVFSSFFNEIFTRVPEFHPHVCAEDRSKIGTNRLGPGPTWQNTDRCFVKLQTTFGPFEASDAMFISLFCNVEDVLLECYEGRL